MNNTIIERLDDIGIKKNDLQYYFRFLDGNGNLKFILSINGMMEILIRNNIYIRSIYDKGERTFRVIATHTPEGIIIYDATFQESFLESFLNPNLEIYKTHRMKMLFNRSMRIAYYTIKKIRELK